MQKDLEFVISSVFLVVRLQRIVPLNKVPCFITLWKYQPSLASYEPLTVLCPGYLVRK